MPAALRLWRVLLPELFRRLPRLIGLNLIWLVCAWPIVTLGAATLTLFAWLRLQQPTRRDLGPLLRRLWWPGTLWALVNALAGFVWLSNLLYWPRVLHPFGQALALVILLLAGWLWLALQPWWLAALADGRPFGGSLRWASGQLLAAPGYALTGALPVLALLVLAVLLKTLWAVAGVSLLLAYWAGLTRPPAPSLHEP